jgi:hypothetical protein
MKHRTSQPIASFADAVAIAAASSGAASAAQWTGARVDPQKIQNAAGSSLGFGRYPMEQERWMQTILPPRGKSQ